MTVLRGYQQTAIHSAKGIYAKGKRRFVIYGPTGSGKTILAESFIRGAIAKGSRVAFIANRIGLVLQASEHLARAGINHGIMQGQNTMFLDQPVLVCSIQTIDRRGLPRVDLIVIDECHGVPGSKAYRDLIFANQDIPIIGLSATPFAKGMAKTYPELGGNPLFEGMVVSATIRELIEQGFLVDCDIYAPSEPDLSGVKLQKNQFGEMDYREQDLGAAVDKPQLIGDIVTHWKRMAGGKPTVCFATNILHSKHITESFLGAGVAAEHIDCYTEDDERKAIMARVSSGKTVVISNVGILTEGWDFPACSVMILARPTKSLIRWIQMAGRILRPFEGKVKGMILDHSGSTHGLGYPTDDLPLQLNDGSPTKAGQKDEKEEPVSKKCPACSYMKPPGAHKCPKCGFAPERQNKIKTEEGELALVNRKKKPDMGDKQTIYSQLLGVQRARGYSSGWVAQKYHTIFGVWPRGMADNATAVTPEVRSWITSQNIRFARGSKEGGANASAAS